MDRRFEHLGHGPGDAVGADDARRRPHTVGHQFELGGVELVGVNDVDGRRGLVDDGFGDGLVHLAQFVGVFDQVHVAGAGGHCGQQLGVNLVGADAAKTDSDDADAGGAGLFGALDGVVGVAVVQSVGEDDHHLTGVGAGVLLQLLEAAPHAAGDVRAAAADDVVDGTGEHGRVAGQPLHEVGGVVELDHGHAVGRQVDLLQEIPRGGL